MQPFFAPVKSRRLILAKHIAVVFVVTFGVSAWRHDPTCFRPSTSDTSPTSCLLAKDQRQQTNASATRKASGTRAISASETTTTLPDLERMRRSNMGEAPSGVVGVVGHTFIASQDRKLKRAFSSLGQSVIDTLEKQWSKKHGKQWGYSADNHFELKDPEHDWLMVTPKDQLGKPVKELVVAERCEPPVHSEGHRLSAMGHRLSAMFASRDKVVRSPPDLELHTCQELWGGFCNKSWRNAPVRRLLGYKGIYNIPEDLQVGTMGKLARKLGLKKHKCPKKLEDIPEVSALTNGTRVISVGRLGGMKVKFWKGKNNGAKDSPKRKLYEMKGGPADTALETMFRNANQTIKMSLQDLFGFVAGSRFVPRKAEWPVGIMNSFCEALDKGVHLYLVLSTPFSRAAYGNGWSLQRMASRFIEWFSDYYHSTANRSADDIRKLVCKQVHLASIRYTKEEDKWLRDESSVVEKLGVHVFQYMGNHAKLYIVDDEIFYIGSENLYPAQLAEYGLIVDDKGMTKDLLTKYWDKLWDASQHTAVSGDRRPDVAKTDPNYCDLFHRFSDNFTEQALGLFKRS